MKTIEEYLTKKTVEFEGTKYTIGAISINSIYLINCGNSNLRKVISARDFLSKCKLIPDSPRSELEPHPDSEKQIPTSDDHYP